MCVIIEMIGCSIVKNKSRPRKGILPLQKSITAFESIKYFVPIRPSIA